MSFHMLAVNSLRTLFIGASRDVHVFFHQFIAESGTAQSPNRVHTCLKGRRVSGRKGRMAGGVEEGRDPIGQNFGCFISISMLLTHNGTRS